MLNNKFVLFFIISLLYGQEFDPETGALIQKKFDPKTGELIKQPGNVEKSDTKLKGSENTIKSEEKEVENTPKFLKKNKVKIIKQNSLSDSEFDRVYSEETMYMKTGFWSSGYEKNGKKISKKRAYKELEKFTESRNVYDQARLRLSYSAVGACLFVISPFFASTDNMTIFFAAYFGGMFTLVYNTISYSNLINKAVWIFNREALKANSNLKLK